MKDLSWKWVLDNFHIEADEQASRPKAVVLFESSIGCFAATFGHSYFLVDNHCDRDYPFSLARRIEFENIKTITLNSQSTTRNRMIYSYLECTELEFESGEAYAKLKANAKLPDGFALFKSSLQFGTSISFITPTKDLVSVANFISYAENAILKRPELHKIPIYSEIIQEEVIQDEEEKLIQKLNKSSSTIMPMEIEIVGTNEIFQSDDYEYELKYRGSRFLTNELSSQSIMQFMKAESITPLSKMLEIKVILYKDGKSVSTRTVHDYIDCVNDESQCMLLQGRWYHFNLDFIDYLNDSIREIPTKYDEKYDFNKAEYDKFLKDKESEPDNKLSTIEIKSKYYFERYFNIIREEDGFINFDRKNFSYAGHRYETCDLLDQNTVYAVKIGSSADKLTYAITQSETSLQLFKSGHNEYPNGISKIGLWFILERKTLLRTNEDGNPDLNDIASISLKIQLDRWKKKIISAGLKPVVFINYKNW